MYRTKDVEAIKNAMPELKDLIQKNKLEKIEPTLNEIKSVNEIIYKFIRDKKRIVYGGYAQNKLIGIKNKEDEFYTKLETPDIEFYTPEPLKDLIALCNILHKKKFKRVTGEEGQHHETYKLFVNFLDYVDISYMPKNIYNNLPYIEIDKMRFTDPTFMLIDSFRVYADPTTSWWRIEKSFLRTELLLKYYPIPKVKENLKIKNLNITNDALLRFIRKQILYKFKTIINIGYSAYNYYLKKAKLKTLLTSIPYYEIISVNYNKDIIKIKEILIKKLGKDLSTKEYYPFFQFTGRSINYLYKNNVILKVYENNNRCIVFRPIKKGKSKIGTFQFIILMILIKLAFYKINNNKNEELNQKIMLNNMFKAKNNYLEKNDLTVMDNSPFKEFTLDCIGTSIDQGRLKRLLIEERKKNNKPYLDINQVEKIQKFQIIILKIQVEMR